MTRDTKESKAVKPNTVAYNVVITACMFAKHQDDCSHAFEIALTLTDLRPDAVTCTSPKVFSIAFLLLMMEYFKASILNDNISGTLKMVVSKNIA